VVNRSIRWLCLWGIPFPQHFFDCPVGYRTWADCFCPADRHLGIPPTGSHTTPTPPTGRIWTAEWAAAAGSREKVENFLSIFDESMQDETPQSRHYCHPKWQKNSDQRRSFPVDLGCGERSAAYDGGKGSVITSLTWATQEMSRWNSWLEDIPHL
jgi:hypothetical protein